jgi:perosamine synthetase
MENIPFFRPSITQAEIQAVVACLESGWLTTGNEAKTFEAEFAAYTGTQNAVALNSATAALHLALDAIRLSRGEAVLVPTMTFAATAEVVRYFDAIPILVDCRSDDLNLDFCALQTAYDRAKAAGYEVRAVIPVHYGGQIGALPEICDFARHKGLAVIEDAAHCCPALYRRGANQAWLQVGAESDVACFSFYANKCITTGEGGMACTNRAELAERMRIMSLHGISSDAWKRFTNKGTWRYEIIAPGFKYNMTDIAAAMGRAQLLRSDNLWQQRQAIAGLYSTALAKVDGLRLPRESPDRRHSWHLYAVQVETDRFKITRDQLIQILKEKGIMTSVHWIPLHCHPYYRDTYKLTPLDFPVAFAASERILSLPIFPGMKSEAVYRVAGTLVEVLESSRR